MGSAVIFSIQSLINVIRPSFEVPNSLMVVAFFASVYLGIMLISTSAERWWLNIPFIRLAPAEQRKTREIIVDLAAIEDTRLIELARTGLLDHLLVVPTFIVKEIQKSLESPDEVTRTRGRKCHEHLKRLECLPQLGLTIKEFHFHDSEDLATRLTRAAKLTQAYLLTSQDVFSLKGEEDFVTTINLETISIALKPGAQRGEALSIKIQRLGKEPKQGVGYLEDGTMVVVNGGGEHLGQTIRTQVLSQKYSSSGKIIFCNAVTGDEKRTIGQEGSQYSQLLSTVL
ncbi:MAG: hypothetical protein JSR46_08325 [Verrucomicrobia bacterium]|nr:hypothetical protein [Verrucomicrobiota bacterium]